MTNKVPFLDLRIDDDKEREQLLDAVEGVFDHGQFILGPEVAELEEMIADACNKQHGLGVGSGTTALYLAIRAVGLGPQDEVIVPALSWIATANAVSLAGAQPVFADIGDDLNLDPESVRTLVGPDTKALLPVHYTGKVCKMGDLQEIAEDHNLTVIEDASQAFAARRAGRPAGSFGDIACFSMNPMKVLPATGEAGMLLTDDESLIERAEILRYNGMIERELCQEPGINGRIDTLQAAMLLKRLPRVEAVIERRREIAERYRDALSDLVGIPREKPSEEDAYYTFTIRTGKRDNLHKHLKARGIEAKIRDPYLMPQQPAYKGSSKGHYPNAEQLVDRLLCLPCHEKMDPEQTELVIHAVRSFFEEGH